ncbi:hypothetical protein [Bacillus sinesaloumensis]|uniref:hypothetical protein n=1 Tax=Litchfieldia sinesaloumensis TaxID=1926280 RepID=UPI00098872CE|nr:hypothetical protein [Bacillus sinesaloumensis]
MGFKFVSRKKWKREAVTSLLYVFTITTLILISFFSFDGGGFTNPILTFVYIVLIMGGIYRATYYLKLHKKDYLTIDDKSFSIYRGNILPRKQIPFSHVQRVVQVNDVIILLMKDGKEEQIDTDYLSNKDKSELTKTLKLLFATKTVGF